MPLEIGKLKRLTNNHTSTKIVFASLQNFYHYKSLTPSKSIPQMRNQDFTERNPNIKAGTYKPMHRDILTKTGFFVIRQRFRTRVRHIMTKNLAKK